MFAGIFGFEFPFLTSVSLFLFMDTIIMWKLNFEVIDHHPPTTSLADLRILTLTLIGPRIHTQIIATL